MSLKPIHRSCFLVLILPIMPAATLICPNWCPFVRGDILSQIWSLHSTGHISRSTLHNFVTQLYLASSNRQLLIQYSPNFHPHKQIEIKGEVRRRLKLQLKSQRVKGSTCHLNCNLSHLIHPYGSLLWWAGIWPPAFML